MSKCHLANPGNFLDDPLTIQDRARRMRRTKDRSIRHIIDVDEVQILLPIFLFRLSHSIRASLSGKTDENLRALKSPYSLKDVDSGC